MLTRWTGAVSTSLSFEWIVIQPYQAGGMTLPRLPPAYAAIDPGQSGRIAPRQASVSIADYDNISGYDELRRMPAAHFFLPVGELGAFPNTPFQRRVFESGIDPSP
jgi:hypothetical protein